MSGTILFFLAEHELLSFLWYRYRPLTFFSIFFFHPGPWVSGGWHICVKPRSAYLWFILNSTESHLSGKYEVHVFLFVQVSQLLAEALAITPTPAGDLLFLLLTAEKVLQKGQSSWLVLGGWRLLLLLFLYFFPLFLRFVGNKWYLFMVHWPMAATATAEAAAAVPLMPTPVGHLRAWYSPRTSNQVS